MDDPRKRNTDAPRADHLGGLGGKEPVTANQLPLSASSFKQLIDDEAELLIRAGISAVFGSTVGERRSRPGTVWISLTSQWGYGRMIRHSDGSSETAAHSSTADRALLIAGRSITTVEDFLALIAAVGRPPKSTQVVAPKPVMRQVTHPQT